MKKILFISLLIINSVICANAEEYSVFFKVGIKTESTEFYSNSCLPCIPKVKILNVEAKAKNKKNIAGGIDTNAVFPITEFSTDHRKIHFLDNANGDRYNVDGIDFDIVIDVYDESIIFDSKRMSIIPSTSVNNGDDYKKSIIDNCKYLPYKGIIRSDGILKNISVYQICNDGRVTPAKIVDNSISVLSDCDSFRFIASSKDNYIKDFDINLSDFLIEVSWWDNHKDQVFRWSVIAVICILFVLVAFILHKKFLKKGNSNRKNSFVTPNSKEWNNDRSDFTEPDEKECVDSPNVNERYAYGELSQKVAALEKSFNVYYNDIKQDSQVIKKKIINVESLVSNTDDKQKILDLTKAKEQLEKDKKELKEANDGLDGIIKQKDAEIESLLSEIENIKKTTSIVGAEKINGYEHFLSFSKHILESCTKAEQLCYNFKRNISAENQLKFEGYFCEFLLSRPTDQILSWNGVFSTLDLNGYAKIPQFSLYIKNKTDKEKVDFLNKQFFEDVVRPYVSCILVLLEQLRTTEAFGIANPLKQQFENAINEILTLCKGEEISVDFHKLFEPINSYDTVEIADNLIPLSVEKNINTEQHDVLLFVKKYAVNSKASDSKEKTVCFIVL